MSVEIFYQNGDHKEFIENKDILKQLEDASSIKIKIDDLDKVNNFLNAIYNISPYTILSPIKIHVEHSNSIAGAQIAKKAKVLNKKTTLNWIVKEIIKNQISLDSKLNDIISMIKERENDAQKTT